MSTRVEASSVEQLGGLLWTIVSTLVSFFLLSIPLLFRRANAMLLSRRGTDPVHPAEAGKRGAISFFQGVVWHERRSPCLHKFSYGVRYALVDLDHAPSYLMSTISDHHMSASEARSIGGTDGPVYLLTVPTSVGYEQNPLSVYYCFDRDETCLRICIAEVTNTPWGERVTFVFDPNGDAVAKPLHVSPFMDMLGVWRMKACVPDQSITIRITVEHPDLGNYFTASLCANRIECLETSSEEFFWLMPHKTALGIYWQALQLWWKGVKFRQHPKYVDGNAYRGRAIEKDGEILANRQDACQTSADEPRSCSHMYKSASSKFVRSFTWCEAQWPWT